MLSNGSHTLPKALPFWYSIDIHLSLASVFAEPQKSRAGWQVAGKYTPVVKHFTPALSSTSMSSVHKNVVPIFLISITNSWSYFCDLCTRIVVKFRCSGLTRVDCWLQARQSEQGLQHKNWRLFSNMYQLFLVRQAQGCLCILSKRNWLRGTSMPSQVFPLYKYSCNQPIHNLFSFTLNNIWTFWVPLYHLWFRFSTILSTLVQVTSIIRQSRHCFCLMWRFFTFPSRKEISF